MNSAGLFRFWHPLHAVHTGLQFQGVISSFPFDLGDERLEAIKGGFVFIEDRKSPAFLGGVALVHAAQVSGKDRGFITSRSRSYF